MMDVCALGYVCLFEGCRWQSASGEAVGLIIPLRRWPEAPLPMTPHTRPPHAAPPLPPLCLLHLRPYHQPGGLQCAAAAPIPLHPLLLAPPLRSVLHQTTWLVPPCQLPGAPLSQPPNRHHQMTRTKGRPPQLQHAPAHAASTHPRRQSRSPRPSLRCRALASPPAAPSRVQLIL